MNTVFFSNFVCRGAYILTLGTALVGVHLTLGHFVLQPETFPLKIYLSVVLVVMGCNFIYFPFVLGLLLFPIPRKAELGKAALGMLCNIPIALFYFYILFSYAF